MGVYTNTQIIFSWTAPVLNGGFPIAYYIAEAQNPLNASGFSQVRCEFNNPTDEFCLIDYETLMASPFNIEFGQKFCLRVIAVNMDGMRSAPSTSAIDKSTNEECGLFARVPDAPNNLRAPEVEMTLQKMSLYWDEPFNGGMQILKYTVYFAQDIKNPSVSDLTVLGESQGLSYDVQNTDGIKKGNYYIFSVIAENALGPSENSQIYRVLFDPPGNPDSVLGLKEIVSKTTDK